MACKRCTKCNREMGYNPENFKECAPCALGFTKESKK